MHFQMPATHFTWRVHAHIESVQILSGWEFHHGASKSLLFVWQFACIFSLHIPNLHVFPGGIEVHSTAIICLHIDSTYQIYVAQVLPTHLQGHASRDKNDYTALN